MILDGPALAAGLLGLQRQLRLPLVCLGVCLGRRVLENFSARNGKFA